MIVIARRGYVVRLAGGDIEASQVQKLRPRLPKAWRYHVWTPSHPTSHLSLCPVLGIPVL